MLPGIEDVSCAEPSVSDEALEQLKFAELLPPHLASATLAARMADRAGAAAMAARTDPALASSRTRR